jgi:hypothetical protein
MLQILLKYLPIPPAAESKEGRSGLSNKPVSDRG